MKEVQRPSVLIVGCGALGGCLAVMLSSVVCVTMYDRRKGTRDHIRQRGLVLKEGRRVIRVKAGVVDSLQELSGRRFDLVIIATKVMGIQETAQEIARSVQARRVFFPQNGFFDIAWAYRLFQGSNVCRGVTTIACREMHEGCFELAYRGSIFLGGDEARWISTLFTAVGVKVVILADPQRAVWSKLIFNAVMNPLPVITGRGYDILKNDDEVYAMVRRAILEGKQIVSAEGFRLAFDPLRMVEGIRRGHYGVIRHMGSTYADVVSGRQTEMPLIMGVLLKAADRRKIMAPALSSIYNQFLAKVKDQA